MIFCKTSFAHTLLPDLVVAYFLSLISSIFLMCAICSRPIKLIIMTQRAHMVSRVLPIANKKASFFHVIWIIPAHCLKITSRDNASGQKF